MREHLGRAGRLFMDETTAPVLDPGRRRTKTGFFWAIASDDRGYGGPDPPVVIFRYAPGRGGVWAEAFLEGFSGRLQCDGYEGDARLTRIARAEGPWTLVHCRSPLRRRLKQVARTTRSPVAEEALMRIGALHGVEKAVLDAPRKFAAPRAGPPRRPSSPPCGPGSRRSCRTSSQAPSSPSTSGSRAAPLGGPHVRPRRRPAQARHQPRREPHPPHRAHQEERAPRRPRGRRRELGLLASLLATCKLSAVDPAAHVAATLEAVINGHPQSRIDELMPRRFAQDTTPSSRAE